MTRVGKNPVTVPEGVSVRLEDGWFYARGAKGELQMAVMPYVDVEIDGHLVQVRAKS